MKSRAMTKIARDPIARIKGMKSQASKLSFRFKTSHARGLYGRKLFGSSGGRSLALTTAPWVFLYAGPATLFTSRRSRVYRLPVMSEYYWGCVFAARGVKSNSSIRATLCISTAAASRPYGQPASGKKGLPAGCPQASGLWICDLREFVLSLNSWYCSRHVSIGPRVT